MTAVAAGAVARGPEVAEVDGFGGLELEDVGHPCAPLVTAITEKPVAAEATGGERVGAGGQVVAGGMGGCAHEE